MDQRWISLHVSCHLGCFREERPSLPFHQLHRPKRRLGYLGAFGAQKTQKTTTKPVNDINVEEPILNCFILFFSFLCLCPTCYGLQMIRSIFEQDAQDERTDKCCEALHRRLIGKTVWIGTITALIHGKKWVIKWCEQNMLGFGENSQLHRKDSIQKNIVWTHSRYLIPMQNTAVFVYFVCPMAFAIRRFWKLMEIVDSGCPFCFRACGIVPSGSGITGPDDAFWGVWVAKSDTNDGVTLKAYLPCKHRATTPRLFYNSIQSGRVIDPCAMQALDWEGLR